MLVLLIHILLFVASAGATIYCLLYAFTASWRSSGAIGWNILTFAVVNMLALDNSTSFVLFGNYPYRDDVVLGTFILIVFAIWWRTIYYIELRFFRKQVVRSVYRHKDDKTP